MKLLVSDYDGTFKEDKTVSTILKNRDAVKRFMDNGNLFAFATGRNYNSIKAETLKYKIPYDYLICNNGAAIFDKKDNLIFKNNILINSIYKTLHYLEKLGFISEINLKDAYGNYTSDYNKVVEIECKLKFKNLSDIKKIKQEISFLSSFSFMNIIVFKEEIDKKDGIYFINSIERIKKENIYTIGDASNDKGMLLEFNGYKMPYSYPEILFLPIKASASVRNLIKKIERN